MRIRSCLIVLVSVLTWEAAQQMLHAQQTGAAPQASAEAAAAPPAAAAAAPAPATKGKTRPSIETTQESLRQKIDSLAAGPPRNDAQKLWSISFAAENIKEYDVAIAAVEKIVELTSSQNNPYIHARLGWLQYLDQDYERAIAHYKAASELGPFAVTPRLGLLNCYLATNRIDQATEECLSIIRLDPLNYRANKSLGDLYYIREDYARSAAYYQRLSTAYPDDLQIAANLGWCYLKLGEKTLAGQIFGNVLAVQPDNISAGTGFAALGVVKGDIVTTTQPDEISEKVVIRNPATATRAVSYTLNGRYPVTLEPGKAQTLEPGRTWTILFEPGAKASPVEQRLDPGEYLFDLTKDRIVLSRQ
jgi:tetratricopeptide (TPR) repeat protein